MNQSERKNWLDLHEWQPNDTLTYSRPVSSKIFAVRAVVFLDCEYYEAIPYKLLRLVDGEVREVEKKQQATTMVGNTIARHYLFYCGKCGISVEQHKPCDHTKKPKPPEETCWPYTPKPDYREHPLWKYFNYKLPSQNPEEGCPLTIAARDWVREMVEAGKL